MKMGLIKLWARITGKMIVRLAISRRNKIRIKISPKKKRGVKTKKNKYSIVK